MKQSRCRQQNRGSTLVEMTVCFVLLGIFMSVAAVVLTNIVNVYYDVKGEAYGRQVSNILLAKVCGEIEGARISEADTYSLPVIFQDPTDALAGNRSGYKMDLYDRTDTHIQIYAEDGELKIRYLEINPPKEDSSDAYKAGHRDEVIWTFDEAVYQGYELKSLRFVAADQGVAEGTEKNRALEDAAYSFSAAENDYPSNVVGVYMTLESPMYGEFYAYRYVKLYNINREDLADFVIELKTATDYDRN